MKRMHGAERESTQRKPEKAATFVRGPWPDHEARQEMSANDNACENLGKHSKNADWERRW